MEKNHSVTYINDQNQFLNTHKTVSRLGFNPTSKDMESKINLKQAA